MMDYKWLKDMYIAHRGFHSKDYPENSIGSFMQAIANGFAIELDVHILADNNIIVFHDNNLKRMTGVDKEVKNCVYKDIKDLTLSNTNEEIPLLKDVLNLVKGRVPLMIELKSVGAVGALEREVYSLVKEYSGKYVIQSFNPYSLEWFRHNAPTVIRGQLSGSYKSSDLAWYKRFLLQNLFMNFISRPHFIHYEISTLPNLIVTLYKILGNPVLGWTARSENQFIKAKKYCDNAVFEGFNPKDI